MATKHLGETIDIHGGGQDLEFPHHENEIAQSEAKTGHTFANYWMHNGYVTLVKTMKNEQILGNFITVHEMIQKWIRKFYVSLCPPPITVARFVIAKAL